MREDAETARVLYFVESYELVVLQELERDVLSVLSTNKVAGHATWVNKMDAANDRFVRARSHLSGQASNRAKCEVAIRFNRFQRPAL